MKTNNIKRTYDWKPDLPDHRDHVYRRTFRAAARPRHFDLRSTMPPIYDQGELGSCTANGLGALVQHADPSVGMPSRLFIYRAERVVEHTVRSDSGAQIRDGIKVLAALGVCPETEWPYVIERFAAKPPQRCYAAALPNRITEYKRIVALDDMLASIAAGHPVVFGFTVYESFESDTVAKTGVLNMPGKNEKLVGGHCVVAVGYDDDTQRLIVRNSWGDSWGMAGHFTMPYAYVTNRNLSDDFWQIIK